MLEEIIFIDKVEVMMESLTVQVREVTRIVKNGEIKSETYHRWMLESGDDLTNQDAKVKAICQAAWA